jgi:hypothetical protein
MTKSKRFGLVLGGFLGLCALQVGEQVGIPGAQGFVSTADARVGRPLTPVSVAGVARRTVRRCAVGVYRC